MAEFELVYHRSGAATDGKHKDLDDSREDILEAIQGKGLSPQHEWISLVESEEQAHLIVEIVDRASFMLGDQKVIAVKISPAATQRFEALEYVGPKESDDVKVRHTFRREEP